MDLEFLQQQISDMYAILNETNAVLLTDDDVAVDENDFIYDYPYTFTVDKYGYYTQGNIMEVKDGQVKVFMTGEEWGDIEWIDANYTPVHSVIQLLDMIRNK